MHRFALLLLLSTACATFRKPPPDTRPVAPLLAADTTEPAPAPEPVTDECKRTDDSRLFWGTWSKVCGVLSGGAGAGTVALQGQEQRAVSATGLGFLACAVATGYLETELALRYTERGCRRQ